MEASSRKIRVGEAAAAIGTTSKALRNWISRYEGKGLKPSAEQTDAWREFNWGDVAALSITKYLVDLGMPAYGAFSVSMGIIEKRWPDLFSVDDPQWTVSDDNAAMSMYLTRDSETLDFGTIAQWGFGSFERSEPPKLSSDARVVLIFCLAPIIHDAFTTLGEMGHPLPKSNYIG